MTQQRLDCMKEPLAEGDWVAYVRPYYHDLGIGKILRFTPKQMRVEPIGKTVKPGDLVYANNTVKLDSEKIIIKILSQDF